jgi:hypothetical protein
MISPVGTPAGGRAKVEEYFSGLKYFSTGGEYFLWRNLDTQNFVRPQPRKFYEEIRHAP